MKKTYLQPTMMVVRLQQQSIICSSPVSRVSGNADLNYYGGGSGPARVRQHNAVEWEDWEQ